MTNISSKANFCSHESQTVYIVREENLISRQGAGGLEFHYRTLVPLHYTGGNHAMTNISSKANFCSHESQTVYIVREENLISRQGAGGLEFHYRTLVLKVQVF